MFCILVTGIPAAGKSTMAKFLGEQLQLPVLSKDGIKELLYDTVGFRSRAFSIFGWSAHRFHLAGGVDVGDQLPRALLYADAAGGAFGIVDGSVPLQSRKGPSGHCRHGYHVLCRGAADVLPSGIHIGEQL